MGAGPRPLQTVLRYKGSVGVRGDAVENITRAFNGVPRTAVADALVSSGIGIVNVGATVEPFLV